MVSRQELANPAPVIMERIYDQREGWLDSMINKNDRMLTVESR